mgnify:CR=1 FL=1
MVDAVYISRRMQDSAPAVMFVKPWGGRLRLRMVDAAYISRRMQDSAPAVRLAKLLGRAFVVRNS